jgi:hypothetical protein
MFLKQTLILWSVNLMLSIFETRFVCYLKQGTHSLYYKDLLFRDIVALYSANYTRHINTFCEQSVTFLNVKAPHSCSFALKGTMTSDVLTVLIIVDKNRRFGEQLSRHCELKFSGLKQYKNFRLTLSRSEFTPTGMASLPLPEAFLELLFSWCRQHHLLLNLILRDILNASSVYVKFHPWEQNTFFHHFWPRLADLCAHKVGFVSTRHSADVAKLCSSLPHV